MKRFIQSLVSAILSAALFAAGIGCPTKCAAEERAAAHEKKSLELPGVLVDAAWLREHSHDNQLVLIDARKATEYSINHIPGAVNLPAQKLMLPDPANSAGGTPADSLRKALGDAGIDLSRTVIIYDGAKYQEAARVFWLLEYSGHPAVAVLNGGFGDWIGRQFEITAAAAVPRVTQFSAEPQPERRALKQDVLKAIEKTDAVILDCRSAPEYSAGHIKKSINVDFERNLFLSTEGVCTLHYPESLLNHYRTEFENKTRIIAYCHVGSRACVSYLALRNLGYPVAVYDGSWREWSSDPAAPIDENSASTIHAEEK